MPQNGIMKQNTHEPTLIADAVASAFGGPVLPLLNKPEYEPCDHSILIRLGKVFFDPVKAKGMTASEVRKNYPRYAGQCPQCQQNLGAMYYSFQHYIAGDW